MKKELPAFIDKWGQTIALLFAIFYMVSSLRTETSASRDNQRLMARNEKLAASVLRTDENLANLWSAIRTASMSTLPPTPPVKAE